MTRHGNADFTTLGFNNRTSSMATRHYGHCERIFTQGDAATSMFCVKQGHVKLTMTSPRRREAAIAILSAGDCFGEGCLNGNEFQEYSATSVHESVVNEVGKSTLGRRLKTEPALTKHLISYLLLRIQRAHHDLAALLMESSEKRLARLLLQLAGFGTPTETSLPIANIDQGTLAQLVGTTRARVSYFMNRFRKKGFIDYNGTLRVNKSLQEFLKE
jgi:CRP/FNR family transcriptional regulator, cyclic AMP receptor protein